MHVIVDEMSESRQTHVTLHDIDPQALEQLVQYAYTAEIVVGEGNVQVSSAFSCPSDASIQLHSQRVSTLFSGTFSGSTWHLVLAKAGFGSHMPTGKAVLIAAGNGFL